MVIQILSFQKTIIFNLWSLIKLNQSNIIYNFDQILDMNDLKIKINSDQLFYYYESSNSKLTLILAGSIISIFISNNKINNFLFLLKLRGNLMLQ